MVSPLNFNRIATDKTDILAVKQEVTGLVNLSKKEFLSERKNIFSLRYLLIQAVESITDACQHILSKIKGLPCEGYVDCIIKAGENQIISKALAKKLRRLADLRNNLVHRYWIIDNDELYRLAKANIDDLEDFVSQIDDFIGTIRSPE